MRYYVSLWVVGPDHVSLWAVGRYVSLRAVGRYHVSLRAVDHYLKRQRQTERTLEGSGRRRVVFPFLGLDIKVFQSELISRRIKHQSISLELISFGLTSTSFSSGIYIARSDGVSSMIFTLTLECRTSCSD
jgi:hypothetical protein